MGEVVFGTGKQGTVYHRDRDCELLNRGRYCPVMEFDFAHLNKPKLCSLCFKNQPVLRVMHVRCCHPTVRPCQHNGGVLVFDPNDSYRRMRYAWPEDAHNFTVVDPLHIS